MTPRARLLIGTATALIACGLGYGMGGGFRVGEKGGSALRNESDLTGKAGSGQSSRSTSGLAGSAAGTMENQIASRRGKWTREQLRASLDAIGQEPGIIHAVRFALKLTEQLGPEDFPMAFETANDSDTKLGEEKDIFTMLAMARWTDLDPAAAAEYVRANEALRRGFVSPMDSMLAGWATINPAAAIAWSKSLPETGDREKGICFILNAVARRDVDEAIALARAHAPELLKDNSLAEALGRGANRRDPEKSARKLAELGNVGLIGEAAGRWAQENPAEALKWAEELPDEKQRAEALKGAWLQFAQKQPEEAAARLSKAPADTRSIEGAGRAVVEKLAEKDSQQAARWAAALPQQAAREEAYAALGEFYGRTSPDKGAKWLDGLAPGDDRDKAVAAFINKTKDKDPSAATDWAMTIRDDRKRINAVRGALAEWFGKSPGAAIEWLQTTRSISDQDRNAILKKR